MEFELYEQNRKKNHHPGFHNRNKPRGKSRNVKVKVDVWEKISKLRVDTETDGQILERLYLNRIYDVVDGNIVFFEDIAKRNFGSRFPFLEKESLEEQEKKLIKSVVKSGDS